MKIHELKEILICLIQQQINRDNALIALIQDTNKKRGQLLLKLACYDTEEKKHGDLATQHGISIKTNITTLENKHGVLCPSDCACQTGSGIPIGWNYPNPYVSQNDN